MAVIIVFAHWHQTLESSLVRTRFDWLFEPEYGDEDPSGNAGISFQGGLANEIPRE
jgi:hypothetical protein